MLAYGIFGGTFDPPHYGHLALAETARVQLHLARVLFVPAGQPPHKQGSRVSAASTRQRLVRAAIADNPAFRLSRVDLDRPGPHYTVDMIRLLRAQNPRVDQWYFLMGEDSLQQLPTWRDPEGILRQAHLAVMPRYGIRADLPQLYRRLPSLRGKLVWLDVPPVHFAASDLRRRVAGGLPLRYLVPPSVESLIREQQLYRS